jgi:hypothetical protein
MRVLTRKAAALLVVAAALAVVLLAPAGGGAASSSTTSYSLVGTATVTPLCLDCLFSDTATGNATCSLCLPDKPNSGSFSLDLPSITTFPPSPCRIKTISGTLSVIWDSGQSSTVNVSGHFIDGKPIVTLSGKFDPSDSVYPSDLTKIILNNFPPSPCTGATIAVTGALTISAS